MKKFIFLGSITFCLVMMVSVNPSKAQEEESTTVQITIKEDGKVTTDTTFEVREGQDPEMIKKIVQQLAAGGDHAHGGAKVLILKDEDGNVTIKELGDDEDHEIYLKQEGHGDHEMMIIESDDEGEKVKIKKMTKEGSKVMVISTDEDIELTEDDETDVDIYVIKKGDKDVRIVKKVRVEGEDDTGEEAEKEVKVEVKTTKKKKKE